MSAPHEHRLWYTRRAGKTLGPFPEQVVRDHLLLGRLREEDEVSRDKVHWRQISQHPDLIPEVMHHVVSDEDRERLEMARHRADERLRERRNGPAPAGIERRQGDRRDPEPHARIRHREMWNDLRTRWLASQPRRLWFATVALACVALLLAGLYGWLEDAPEVSGAPDCQAPPSPGVNWNYCRFDGADLGGVDLSRAQLSNIHLVGANLSGAGLQVSDLAYAELRGARLEGADLSGARLVGAVLSGADLGSARLAGADLSYANLLEARLSGAELDGARLDQAVWVDGHVCAAGSLGSCR